MRADLTGKKSLRCEEVASPRSLAVRRSAARQDGSLLARRLTAQPPAPYLSLEDPMRVLPSLLCRLWAAQYSLRMRATSRALEGWKSPLLPARGRQVEVRGAAPLWWG